MIARAAGRWQLAVRLGWRNVWRYWRRNLLLVFAIAAGVVCAMAMFGFIAGWQKSLLSETISSLPGAVQVTAHGYREDPKVANALHWDVDMAARLAQVAGVSTVVPRVSAGAIVRSEYESRGVMLLGIDPDLIGETFLAKARIEGRPLANAEDGGLLIGAELARVLQTKVGNRVVFMVEDAIGERAEFGATVVGTFATESIALERSAVVVGIAALQRRLALGTKVHSVALFGPAEEPGLSKLVAGVRDELSRAPAATSLQDGSGGLAIASWRELAPLAASLYDYTAIVGWLISSVIFAALAFGIVNTLLAAILERNREFGLLLALGMRPGNVTEQLAFECGLLLALALAIGGVIGGVGLTVFEWSLDLSGSRGLGMPGMGTQIQLDWHAMDMLKIALVLFVIGLLVSIFPVRRALRADAMSLIRRA